MEKKLLIVSDDNEIAARFKTISYSMGMEAMWAENIEEARQSLGQEVQIQYAFVALSKIEDELQIIGLIQQELDMVPLWVVRPKAQAINESPIPETVADVLPFPASH